MPSPGLVALIKLDIDNFTQINATWGHGVGDDVLRRVGAVCLNTCQPGDVVARLGADAFAIVARVLAPSRAQQFAELMCGRIEATALTLPNGEVVPLTASVGIAIGDPATLGPTPVSSGGPANVSAPRPAASHRVGRVASRQGKVRGPPRANAQGPINAHAPQRSAAHRYAVQRTPPRNIGDTAATTE